MGESKCVGGEFKCIGVSAGGFKWRGLSVGMR